MPHRQTDRQTLGGNNVTSYVNEAYYRGHKGDVMTVRLHTVHGSITRIADHTRPQSVHLPAVISWTCSWFLHFPPRLRLRPARPHALPNANVLVRATDLYTN